MKTTRKPANVAGGGARVSHEISESEGMVQCVPHAKRHNTMKNAFKTVIAAILLLVAVSPLRTQAAVSVYAEDVVSNAAAATVESPSATTNRTWKGSSDSGNPPVRIDETGVHAGGPNPVDINAPDLSRYHRTKEMDVLRIVTVLSPFCMVVAIIAMAGYFAHRRNKMAHETLRTMIEKGLPVTPELVAQLRGKHPGNWAADRPHGRRLLPGLVLVGVGAALTLNHETRGGLICLFIGVAFVIVWLMERNNQNNAQPPRQ